MRNPDYAFLGQDGYELFTGDLYQPLTTNLDSIATSLIKKSGQTDIGIVELTDPSADIFMHAGLEHMAHSILTTPGHSIKWIIFLYKHFLESFKKQDILHSDFK